MESSYHRIDDSSGKAVGYQLESSGMLQCCGNAPSSLHRNFNFERFLAENVKIHLSVKNRTLPK